MAGSLNKKLGVLGGGQLGRMMCLAVANMDIAIDILDKDHQFPAGQFANRFVEGDFKNYDDVYKFGKTVDVLTIEIEHVNSEALHQLKAEGIIVHPDPSTLDIIKDKGLQKQFYEAKGLPTSPFVIYDDFIELKKAIQSNEVMTPFVQKARTAGYDGKGVAVIKSAKDYHKLLQVPSIIEPLVAIEKELAVIVSRNESGEIAVFPTVEMEFLEDANLVNTLICPARLEGNLNRYLTNMAKEIMIAYNVCGMLAIEFFLTKSGEILINEVAPRTHNSGHHTIESSLTSQFEQHVRSVLNLPLGSTKMRSPSVMINLLGAPKYSGPVIYQGLEKCMQLEGVYFHLYGKKETRPFRKMGHATIINNNLETAMQNANFIKENFKIISNQSV